MFTFGYLVYVLLPLLSRLLEWVALIWLCLIFHYRWTIAYSALEAENVPPGMSSTTLMQKKICSWMLSKWLFTCFVVLAHKVSVKLIQAILLLDLLPSDCFHCEAKCHSHERQHCYSRHTAVCHLCDLEGSTHCCLQHMRMWHNASFWWKREDDALNKLFLLYIGCSAFYMCPLAFLLSLSSSLFKKTDVNLCNHWQLKIKDPTENNTI